MRYFKLKAFTLMELTIAMLISAISIGMAFYMLQYFQKLFISQQRKRQERFSYALFRHLIQQDLSAATWLKATENGFICTDDNGDINYYLDPKFIVRNQYNIHKDTFLIKTVSFDTAPKLQNLHSQDITDHVNLRTEFEHTEHPFEYIKIYSAQQLLEIESPPIN